VIVSLGEAAKNSRPIVIKEAKALREYYEDKFKDMKEKTDKAEEDCAEYKKLYESELQRSSDRNGIMSRKVELEKQVERLINDLDSCEDRINDMALENANLKEQIEALKKPASKKTAKKEDK
jgi:chromosome segregation ATPase